MSGQLLLGDRKKVVLAVWPELAGLGVGYILGHAILVEAVLEDDPKAPVDAATRVRIKEAAREFLGKEQS